MRRLFLVLFASSCLGCQQSDSLRQASFTLPPGAFASLDGQPLKQNLLAGSGKLRLAQARGVLHDGLLAHELSVVAPHAAAAIQRAVLSRALLDHLQSQLLADSPPPARALAAQRKKNWLLYDRPRAVRTARLSVSVPTLAPYAPRLAYAEELRARAIAAQPAHLDELLDVLRTVEKRFPGEMQRLPPVAADGRVVPMIPQDHEFERLDADYAKRMSQLREPGEISEVFPYEDGFSFAFVVEIVAPHRPPGESINQALVAAALAGPVRQKTDRIVSRGRFLVKGRREQLAQVLGLVWRK